MKKQLFINTIQAIKNQMEYDNKTANQLVKVFPDCHSANLLYNNQSVVTALINLLTEVMNDKAEWIKHFIYELDFGKQNNRLKVYINDIEIPLTTIDDLYNILTKK